ncbi:Man1-Src1p-C-terminal domain-containing protein [Lentinula lateritia]|nr:Man1-Src1p-C-terminal domain-containing protein [Lentinula lateritia]
MSRLTAAQIIAQGDYLEPEFQPTTLTISQLLGVLGYHNIIYPTPYSKAKLVQVFNDEVKRRAAKFKKERIKKENSIASDDGIKDGVTGEYLSGVGDNRCLFLRSSRRLSRAPLNLDDEEESPPRPDPPKRRRSSAQPRLGGASSRKAAPPPPVQPAVLEESEPEEAAEDQEPVRKVKRTTKRATAGTQSRRISQADDSGWEDNNIFQSGAESSSPLRPSPARPKGRKSVAGPRKSRKSMSAPPNVSPSSSPSKSSFIPNFSPPQSKFEPEIPDQWKFVSKPYTPPSHSSRRQEVQYEDLDRDAGEISETDLPNMEMESEGLDDADEQSAVIQQQIADEGTILKRSRQSLLTEDTKPMSALSRLLLLALVGVVSYFTFEYKEDSASIGYCDTGSNTNRVLEELKSTRSLIIECNNENRTTLYDHVLVPNSPPCPVVPITLYPESCTPCPEHAICSGHTIACEKAYILKSPFLLSFLPPIADPSKTTLSTSVSPSDIAWKVISIIFDGLPGFGSVAFPPSCVEDPRRKRHIGALGKGIEALLGQHRGSLLCNAEADIIIKDVDGGEARRWGMQVHELKENMREGVDPQHVLSNFDDLFNEAVQQLVQWGGVLISEDAKGQRYLAHKTASLSLTCKLTVKSRETWSEWRGTIAALIVVYLFFYASSSRRSKKKIESKRIANLVQIAIDALQHQELAHYTDPVSTPQPFLSSIQLRDLVLQEEHSVIVRQKVWEKVEKIVEGNANVRANLEEVYGGDELRVWRWVGSTAGSIDGGRGFVKQNDRLEWNSPSSLHEDMEEM